MLDEISALARQLRLNTSLVYKEIYWALGGERINRVTPTDEQFREWKRSSDGLTRFWSFANGKLGSELSQDEAHDIWECIDLTLRTGQRRPFSFQDYLMIAVHSDQCCDICKRRPPDVDLDIDHILPFSRGGGTLPFNLRFLWPRSTNHMASDVHSSHTTQVADRYAAGSSGARRPLHTNSHVQHAFSEISVPTAAATFAKGRL